MGLHCYGRNSSTGIYTNNVDVLLQYSSHLALEKRVGGASSRAAIAFHIRWGALTAPTHPLPLCCLPRQVNLRTAHNAQNAVAQAPNVIAGGVITQQPGVIMQQPGLNGVGGNPPQPHPMQGSYPPQQAPLVPVLYPSGPRDGHGYSQATQPGYPPPAQQSPPAQLGSYSFQGPPPDYGEAVTMSAPVPFSGSIFSKASVERGGEAVGVPDLVPVSASGRLTHESEV